MNECYAEALSNLIVEHIRLGRSRCETLGWLIASILTAGTVTLTRLAAHIDSNAQIASVHRRLERFFSDVRLNEAEVARLVVAALSLTAKPWHLAIDRTNWQFGKTDLNLLVLSVAHGDVCILLFCRVLDKAGNSNTAERIDLMQSFKATFPDQPIVSLTGDREFIGNTWIEALQQATIPHFLRLREDMRVFNDGHAPLPLRQHGARLKTGQRLVLKGCWRLGVSERNASPPVRIVILRLKTSELLIIASRSRPQYALNLYRQRWRIETLFAALKTRGFNLEATHMTDPAKLSTLIAILAMAASVAYNLGTGRSTTPLQSARPSGTLAVRSWPRCAAQALRGKNVCPIAPSIARLADRKQHGKSALFRGLGVSVGYYAVGLPEGMPRMLLRHHLVQPDRCCDRPMIEVAPENWTGS